MSGTISNYFPPGPGRQPGRPTIGRDTLAGIRDDLVLLLCLSWSEIGWQLRHATSPEQLRQAFEPLRGKNNGHLIARFLKNPTVATTGKEIRFTRRLLDDAVTRRYAAQANCSDPVRDYIEAETAVMQSPSEQMGQVRRELLKRQFRLLAVRKELHCATELEHTLEKQLGEQEVSFAQEELFRILEEERCARNPLKLANAMAGLPFITARVSHERCSKIKPTGWPKFDFQVFQKIESIWNMRDRYPKLSLVQLYRQEISKLPRTMRRNKAENPLRARLGDHFGYLKLAIKQSVESGVDSDRVPFLITSNFDKHRAGSTTPLSRTLAASERID
jgi:hypothetical protein